ncbi:isoleucyl-tRNA synthetase [Klebsiella michiganensis]|uniref:Isoleucyl-tRNA synthetase n=1 Tax=Klebsiella michiganensis TaxID=1134687 RepID=A0A7H4N801_9ENTR|nr:isoleucyl-tRNA synthetase [Klebsiella michiganensis]
MQWIPDWGQARIESMVANRPDWCISRQRTWGVPMSLFVHKETQELHPRTLELMEEVAKRVEVDGIQAWWDLDSRDILGADADSYEKVPDTLDVWFDSGSTHSSVVDVRPEFAGHAADMYLEGSDQHRGWFMSSPDDLYRDEGQSALPPGTDPRLYRLMARAARCPSLSATPFLRRT